MIHAATINASTCGSTDVQAAITAAARGDTVTIPAGTCTWSSGVTISGKGILVTGAGSGRIVAYGSTTLTLGTGAKTITVLPAQVGNTLAFSNGDTLTVSELGNRQNFMIGTVTSYSAGSLVMSMSSSGGTCGTGSSSSSPSNCKRWLVSTPPTTILVNNSTAAMFAVTEDSSFNTKLSGFKISEGTGSGNGIDLISGGGAAIVVQNCWIEQGSGVSVHTAINRGVVSNCSFDSTPFSRAPIAIDPQPFDTTAWSTQSYWGSSDTDGLHNFYVETCDFHAYLLASDNDEGARTIYRYNVLNNAGLGGHGADTGPFGARYFEMYNNVGVFNGYNDGTTFSMNQWYYVRGGSFVVYNNTLPALTSTDFGTKDDLNMTVMNLQRNAGPNPCWSMGTTGGADYFTPHQVGFGFVTGAGVDGHGNTTYSAASYGFSSMVYVGDSEPGYIWGNSRQPLGNTATSDYGSGQGDSCGGTTDTSANYIIANRDYFNGATAKPGWSPYTYPHPLTQASSSGGGSSFLGASKMLGASVALP